MHFSNVLQFFSAISIAVILSACTSNISKPSGFHKEFLDSNSRNISIYFEPNRGLSESDISSTQHIDKLEKLITTFKLEDEFIGLLKSEFSKSLPQEAYIINNDSDYLVSALANMSAELQHLKSQKMSYETLTQFLNTSVSKRDIAFHALKPEDVRIIIQYGISDDLKRMGVNAKLIIAKNNEKGELSFCTDHFFISELTPQKHSNPQIKKTSLAMMVANYHLLRQSFLDELGLLAKYIVRQSKPHRFHSEGWFQKEYDFVSYDNEHIFLSAHSIDLGLPDSKYGQFIKPLGLVKNACKGSKAVMLAEPELLEEVTHIATLKKINQRKQANKQSQQKIYRKQALRNQQLIIQRVKNRQ